MPRRPKKRNRPWKPPVDKTPFGRRKADNQDFYNSPKWRKVARSHKERNPFCVKCQEMGVVSAVEFTDHIVRIEDGGEKFDDSNLQSLCGFHHNQKSGREAHGYKEQKK